MHRGPNAFGEIIGAVYRKDLAALRQLDVAAANCRDADGRTPLMHAILASDADPVIVRLLIERGANVNASDAGQRWTPLHFAARDQNADIVRVLLDANAAVDPLDAFGNTPLWRAVMNARSELAVVEGLVARGADPAKKNNHGSSPIDVAHRMNRPDIAAVLGRSGHPARQ